MDRFVAMNAFRTVVERQSFTQAARHLGMSVGSVSKYVASIEAHLGTALLARTTRRIAVTEAGRDYYARCARLLDDLDELEKSTARRQTVPSGPLKVRAPVSLDDAGLGRLVAGFLAAFPAVTVDMTLNDRFIDLDGEGFDVALALGSRQKYQALPRHSSQPIASMRRMLVASPAYVRAAGTPRTLPELKRHACLVYDRGPAPDEWHFTARRSERMVRVHSLCRSNNSQVLKDAVLEGCGIALLPAFMVMEDVRAGRLKRMLPGWTPTTRTLYAVFPRPGHASPKTCAFVNFVASHFDDSEAWGREAADGFLA